MFSKSMVLTVIAMTFVATNYQNAQALGVLSLSSRTAGSGREAQPAQTTPPAITATTATQTQPTTPPGAIVPAGRTQAEGREGVIVPAADSNTTVQNVVVDGAAGKVQLKVTISKNKLGDYEAKYSYKPKDFGAHAAGCLGGECDGTELEDTITSHNLAGLNDLGKQITERVGAAGKTATATPAKPVLTKEERDAKALAKREANCELDEDDDSTYDSVRECIGTRYNELLDAYEDASDRKEKSIAKEALMEFMNANQERLASMVVGGGADGAFAEKFLNNLMSKRLPFSDLKTYSTTTFSVATKQAEANYQQMVQLATANAASNPQAASYQMSIANGLKAQMFQVQAKGFNSYSQLLSGELPNSGSHRVDINSQVRTALNISELSASFSSTPVGVLPNLYQSRADLNAGCYALKMTSTNDCKVVDLVTGSSVNLVSPESIAANNNIVQGIGRTNRFDGTGYAPMFTDSQIPQMFMVSGGQLVQVLPGASSIPQTVGPTSGNPAVDASRGRIGSGRT